MTTRSIPHAKPLESRQQPFVPSHCRNEDGPGYVRSQSPITWRGDMESLLRDVRFVARSFARSSGVLHRHRAHAGARHRRHDGDLQRRERRPPAAASVPALRPIVQLFAIGQDRPARQLVRAELHGLEGAGARLLGDGAGVGVEHDHGERPRRAGSGARDDGVARVLHRVRGHTRSRSPVQRRRASSGARANGRRERPVLAGASRAPIRTPSGERSRSVRSS